MKLIERLIEARIYSFTILKRQKLKCKIFHPIFSVLFSYIFILHANEKLIYPLPLSFICSASCVETGQRSLLRAPGRARRAASPPPVFSAAVLRKWFHSAGISRAISTPVSAHSHSTGTEPV